MSAQVSRHGAESMPPPQLAPPGAYGQREVSPKRDFTQAFSAARFHASNQDTSPSRRLPMARAATQGHPSLGSSLASPPPLNGGFAMPTRKRAKTLEGGNNQPSQLHEPHPQSHGPQQQHQQQQQQRGSVQGRYYPLTASASVPDMKAATSSASVHTPALEPSHTSDSSTASSASLPARARSRSPPRTPPPRRRGDDSAEASSSQDRDGADLLMYLAASPSPAQKLHGNYAAQSQPNSSPFNPPSVQATPSTPHQGFNFNEYLNLLTPSPARGPNGQGTPQVDRPLLRSARQRLNFDQLPSTSGGDSGSSSSSSQATVQANGPSEAPTSFTRESHSEESTGSASASSGIMASN